MILSIEIFRLHRYVVPVGLVILIFVLSIFGVNKHSSEQNEAQYGPANTEEPNRPMIIWLHGIDKDPNVLATALSSDVLTHVMIGGLHKYDRPSYTSDPKFEKSLQICRQANVGIIWMRWLWPGYNMKDFTNEKVFSADYYVQQILNIKAEAERLDAQTAFDIEPYGNSTIRDYQKRNLTESEYDRILRAVASATETVGSVDYVLPSYYPFPRHTRFDRDFYRPLQKIGRMSISEHTYYNQANRIFCEDNVYDIFGVYPKANPPKLPPQQAPFFSSTEIYKKRDLWGDKKGLFIYPGEDQEVLELAKEFSRLGHPRVGFKYLKNSNTP